MDAIKRKQNMENLVNELRMCATALETDIANMPPIAYTDEEMAVALAAISQGLNNCIVQCALDSEIPIERIFRALLELKTRL